MMAGRELKAIRKAAGLDQRKLARLIGYSRQMISEWERGAQAIPLSVERNARHLAESPTETLAKWAAWDALAESSDLPALNEEGPSKDARAPAESPRSKSSARRDPNNPFGLEL